MAQLKASIRNMVSADATHLLECRHCYNSRSSRDYTMRCIPLKTMPDGRLKLLVFGNLYWGGDQKKIRYVEAHRVNPIEHNSLELKHE